MLKRWLCVLVLLAGCAAEYPKTGPRTIVWHIEDPVTIQYLWDQMNPENPIFIDGFANWGGEYCHIWTPELTEETLYIFLHELRHCVDGHFHDD